MHNAHGHIVKMPFGAGTKINIAMLALALVYTTSTYQEHLLSEVIKRKHLSLISKLFFRFAFVKYSHVFVTRYILTPWSYNPLP